MLNLTKIQQQLDYNQIQTSRYTDWLCVPCQDLELQVFENGELTIVNPNHHSITDLTQFANILEIINSNQEANHHGN